MEKKNTAAAKLLGSLGGKAKVPKGLSMLSLKERKKIARKGAAARWGKKAT